MTRLFLGTAAALFLAAPAYADETYGALRAGFNDAEAEAFGGTVSFQQGSSFEAALGRDTGFLRLEASAARDTADLGMFGAEATLVSYAATALVDVEGPFGLTYSAGAGLHFAQAEANLGFAQVEGDGDGWHYDLGISKNVSDAWTVELRRRASDGEVDLNGVDVGYSNTAWTVGLRRAL